MHKRLQHLIENPGVLSITVYPAKARLTGQARMKAKTGVSYFSMQEGIKLKGGGNAT